MKKLKIVIVIIVISFIVVGFTAKTLFTKTIKINANFTKVIEEINKPEIIKKWFSPFVGLDSSVVKIKDSIITTTNNGVLEINQKSYIDYLYKYSANNFNKKLLVSASADTNVNYTNVTFSYDATLFDKFLGYTKATKLINASIANLQKLNTDTKLFYGYEINEEPVTDTTFIFSKQVVAASNVTKGLKLLFEKIDYFSTAINAQKTDARIFYVNTINKDSIELMAALGISNTSIQEKITGDFILKRMPYQKNLVVATYKGTFNNIVAAQDAVVNYTKDNGLTKLAIPFTKLITAGYSFDSNQIIQAKVCMPIF